MLLLVHLELSFSPSRLHMEFWWTQNQWQIGRKYLLLSPIDRFVPGNKISGSVSLNSLISAEASKQWRNYLLIMDEVL